MATIPSAPPLQIAQLKALVLEPAQRGVPIPSETVNCFEEPRAVLEFLKRRKYKIDESVIIDSVERYCRVGKWSLTTRQGWPSADKRWQTVCRSLLLIP